MAEQQKTSLRDVINYSPEQYLSEEELAIIRSTFKGNDRLIKILRKIMVPSAADLELPIEEVGSDVWMLDKDFAAIPNEEIKTIVVGRQNAIKYIFGGLIKLKVIANQTEESEQERNARRAKDSAK
jgi:hypothetical protein